MINVHRQRIGLLIMATDITKTDQPSSTDNAHEKNVNIKNVQFLQLEGTLYPPNAILGHAPILCAKIAVGGYNVPSKLWFMGNLLSPSKRIKGKNFFGCTKSMKIQ